MLCHYKIKKMKVKILTPFKYYLKLLESQKYLVSRIYSNFI